MFKLSRLALPFLLGVSVIGEALAVPAKPGEISFTKEDGTTITVNMFGDEQHHFFTTTDGYVLLRKGDHSFNYAIPADDGTLVDSNVEASDIKFRSSRERDLISGIDKAASLKAMQKRREAMPLRGYKKSPQRISDESRLTTFPTVGSPKLLFILVEYSDVKFFSKNPHETFQNMLTQQGYSKDGATGSIKDYFTASSNGQFTPQFDLYGPVTLPHPMSYYGANDGTGQDSRPAEMLPDACTILDNEIDFSQYDNDNDGVVDNVYIFYAGYGEADGGPGASVWPHSWDMEYASSKPYIFDGVRLNHYACSNELRDGAGTLMAGIGVFCHEFSHVMGLPDLYSTNYSGAFTPGAWSLMDYGSYNNNSRTPPLHTGYERYCFNWVEPKVLNDPCNVTIGSVSEPGHYDDVYMIKTRQRNEYYILENRQQTDWDAFAPGHGMLVWHIDFNPDVWTMNIVNVAKQYIDVVEADAEPSRYSITGDSFPGTAGVTAFTDDTNPSMKTWNGEKLFAPITEIKEIDGTISFMFKGGEDIFEPVVANVPTIVKAGSFVATWNKVANATGYLLSVYTTNSEGVRVNVGEFDMKEVGDVDNFNVTGLTPLTTYYYEVRATNGKFYSKESNLVEVKTIEPTIDFKTVEATPATDITPTSFVATWQPLEEAKYYTLNVYTRQLGEPFIDSADFTDNQLPEGWTSESNTFDSRDAYSATAPAMRLGDNQAICTKNYRNDIRTLSFWYRGSTSLTENSLDIMGMVNNEWITIQTVAPVLNTRGGETVKTDNIPEGCCQIKLVFKRPNSGYIYIDDVIVGYGGNYEELPLQQYTNVNVGTVTSYKVEGLTPGQSYSYDVVGHDGELSSLQSNLIAVTLPIDSGIDELLNNTDECHTENGSIVITTAFAQKVTIYDMSGRIVLSATQQSGTETYEVGNNGAYIVVVGTNRYKVLL